MLTGYINYKDKDYSFVLDEDINELKLIPIKDSNYIELVKTNHSRR